MRAVREAFNDGLELMHRHFCNLLSSVAGDNQGKIHLTYAVVLFPLLDVKIQVEPPFSFNIPLPA